MMIFVLFISFLVNAGMHEMHGINYHVIRPVSTGLHGI